MTQSGVGQFLAGKKLYRILSGQAGAIYQTDLRMVRDHKWLSTEILEWCKEDMWLHREPTVKVPAILVLRDMHPVTKL